MEGTELDQHLTFWLKGDQDAIALAILLGELSQSWDDWVDGDKEVGADKINYVMRLSMIDIPKNPFYRRHFAALHPVIEDRIYTWLDCNTIESKGDNRQLMAAYILRSVVTDIVIHMAFLVGGFEWRQQVAFDIRAVVYNENESWESYYREHRREK